MNEEKDDNTISINRIKKLLESLTNEIQSIEKHAVHNSPLFQEIMDFMNTHIELFKEYAISEMKKPPKEKHIINLDYSTKITKISSEIGALQETYKEHDLNSEIFPKDIVTCINNEEKIIRNIMETSEVEIAREIEESMQKMLIIKEKEKAQRKQLQSEIDAAECRLQKIMERNAINKKKLHNMCTQVERKYVDLLSKYDYDIGVAYTLKEKLLQDNEIIKVKTKNMEDQLVIQRGLYARFKKEREIALMKIFTEKLEFFRQTRAARIIQKTWRIYFERISLKKRRKSRKK
ncbi:hypothetical protein HN011_003184 [Eciton burchellii]|nr:hypothetical protein HN011_003184 [Eciton burchellii]